MSTTNSDDLTLKIKADIKELQQGLRQAAKEADIAGKAMESSMGESMSHVEKSLKVLENLQIGEALVEVGKRLAEAAEHSFDFAEQLTKVTNKTGISTEAFQKYAYAAKEAGISNEDLGVSLDKFTKKLGAAQAGNPAAIATFKALGFSLSEIKNIKPEEALEKVIAYLEKLPDSANRGTAAVAAFGKGGLDMAAVASLGAGKFKELTDEAERLGLVIGGDLVKSGDEAAHSIDRLKSVIGADLNKALLQAAPQVDEFIHSLLADPEAIQKRVDDLTKIAQAIVTVGAAAGTAIGWLVDLTAWLGESFSKLTHVDPFDEAIQKAQKNLNHLQGSFAVTGLMGSKAYQEVEAKIRAAADQVAHLKQLQDDYNKSAAKAPASVAAPEKKESAGAVKPFRDPTGDAALKAERDKDLKLIEEARRFNADAEKLENSRYEEQVKNIKAITDVSVISERDKNDLLAGLALAHSQKIDAIREGDLKKEIQAEEQRMALVSMRHKELQELEIMASDFEAAELKRAENEYEAQLKLYHSFTDDELKAIGGANEVKEGIEKQHQDQLLKLKQGGLKSGFTSLVDVKNKELRSILDSGAVALTAMSGHNKKAFELNKVAAIANAIVNTYDAANQALSDKTIPSYYAKVAAAAAAVATGLSNVAAIESTSFGGGGGGGGSGGGASVAPAQAAPQISLALYGNTFSASQVRDLIKSINTEISNGATLKV